MESKEMDLEKEYGKLKEKYNLPALKSLSEDFGISKVEERDPAYLIRAVRKFMSEKVSVYSNLLEVFINPSDSPLFVLSALRNLTEPEKRSIKEMYKELSLIQIEVMRLDTVYDEKREATFVINTFNQWQKLKPRILKIVDKLGEGLEKEEDSRERGYFG